MLNSLKNLSQTISLMNILNACLCSSSTEAAVKPALPAARRRSQVGIEISQRHATADEREWQVITGVSHLDEEEWRYRREEEEEAVDMWRLWEDTAAAAARWQISVHCQGLHGKAAKSNITAVNIDQLPEPIDVFVVCICIPTSFHIVEVVQESRLLLVFFFSICSAMVLPWYRCCIGFWLTDTRTSSNVWRCQNDWTCESTCIEFCAPQILNTAILFVWYIFCLLHFFLCCVSIVYWTVWHCGIGPSENLKSGCLGCA